MECLSDDVLLSLDNARGVKGGVFFKRDALATVSVNLARFSEDLDVWWDFSCSNKGTSVGDGRSEASGRDGFEKWDARTESSVMLEIGWHVGRREECDSLTLLDVVDDM